MSLGERRESVGASSGPDPGADTSVGAGGREGAGERNPVEPLGAGVFAWKGLPRYGRQDLGYTPDGAQDRCSFLSGNALLGNPPAQEALELVFPPDAVRFRVDCFFALTGGHLQADLATRLHNTDDLQPIDHATVYHAPAGSELRFGRRVYGFRTYLCVISAGDADASIAGRRRGSFESVFRWPHPEGLLRVMDGPEREFLVQPSRFLETPWRTTQDMSDMGIRLAVGGGNGRPMPEVKSEQLISAPVCDGTIQMTPSGPIVLLRDRQTTGGYPRVFVVISADLDLVAQYAPGRIMRFTSVTSEEARRIAQQRRQELEILRERFGE